MEEQKELREGFRQQQEKYVYYIIALAVTAIGFSIYTTTGKPLEWSQIPLGLSVLSWGASIFCGLTFIKYVLSTMYANYKYFDVSKGRDPEVGSNPERIEGVKRGIKSAMTSNVGTAEKYFDWQQKLFYAGACLFIIWHVVEMYLNTVS